MPVSPTDGLVAFLLASPGVADLISKRITPQMAPQGMEHPTQWIVYHVVSWPQNYSLQGPLGLTTIRVQIECWASGRSGYVNARKLRQAVEQGQGGSASGPKLDGFHGNLGGCPVAKVAIENRRDGFDDPQEGTQIPFRYVAMDLMISGNF